VRHHHTSSSLRCFLQQHNCIHPQQVCIIAIRVKVRGVLSIICVFLQRPRKVKRPSCVSQSCNDRTSSKSDGNPNPNPNHRSPLFSSQYKKSSMDLMLPCKMESAASLEWCGTKPCPRSRPCESTFVEYVPRVSVIFELRKRKSIAQRYHKCTRTCLHERECHPSTRLALSGPEYQPTSESPVSVSLPSLSPSLSLSLSLFYFLCTCVFVDVSTLPWLRPRPLRPPLPLRPPCHPLSPRW
jgi:hypothetical protein